MFEKANTNLSSMELAQKSLCLPNERIVYLTPGTCRLTSHPYMYVSLFQGAYIVLQTINDCIYMKSKISIQEENLYLS